MEDTLVSFPPNYVIFLKRTDAGRTKKGKDQDILTLKLPPTANASQKTAIDLINDLAYYSELPGMRLSSEQKLEWTTDLKDPLCLKDPLSLWAAIFLCFVNHQNFPDWVRYRLAILAGIFLGWVTQSKPPDSRSIPALVTKCLNLNRIGCIML
jgi:hypothetical protein